MQRPQAIRKLYKDLLKQYGPQGWWPVTQDGQAVPEYHVKGRTDCQRLEIAIGAILTQNTSGLLL